jgi:hypothetical protein
MSLSTVYPQFSTDIHSNEPTLRSVDFPCFFGSVSVKPFAFKAFRPVDNSDAFECVEMTQFCLFSACQRLISGQ